MKTIVAVGMQGRELEGGHVIGETFMIDDVDEDLVGYQWRLHRGYAVTDKVGFKNARGRASLVSLHRLIASFMYEDVFDGKKVVGFKNNDKKDCTRGNIVIKPRTGKLNEAYAKARELMDKYNEVEE